MSFENRHAIDSASHDADKCHLFWHSPMTRLKQMRGFVERARATISVDHRPVFRDAARPTIRMSPSSNIEADYFARAGLS